MVLDMEFLPMACRVLNLFLSLILAQSAIGESRWSTPWIELSDEAEWIDAQGPRARVHRAAVAMDDGSSVLFISTPGEATRVSLRAGDGSPGVIVPQSINLGGTILDSAEMPDGRFIVLLHESI